MSGPPIVAHPPPFRASPARWGGARKTGASRGAGSVLACGLGLALSAVASRPPLSCGTNADFAMRSHHNKHTWVSSGITRDGRYRLECRCGAAHLRPIRSPRDGTGVEGEPDLRLAAFATDSTGAVASTVSRRRTTSPTATPTAQESTSRTAAVTATRCQASMARVGPRWHKSTRVRHGGACRTAEAAIRFP